jgi:predicted N-acetyltransferase YhbS
MVIVPLLTIAPDLIEALLDRAFGPDRRARTAYRVREGLAPIPDLSFAAVESDGGLIGTLQSWPVALAGDDGRSTPLIMVGPVAVEPGLQRGGVGRTLMHHAIAAAGASSLPGADKLMLVGDPEYYTRFFGFTADRTGAWRLPGPWESRRLLARGDVPAAAGMIEARQLVPSS